MLRAIAKWSALALVLTGCSDLGTVPNPVLTPGSNSPNYNTSEGDPPKDWPVALRLPDVAVWFAPSYPGNARIETSMKYDAYHASIGGNVTVSDGSTVIQRTFTPVERHTFYDYYNQLHSATFPVMLQKNCGTTLQGEINYRAWWRGAPYPGGYMTLDEATATKPYSRAQPPCQQSCDPNDPTRVPRDPYASYSTAEETSSCEGEPTDPGTGEGDGGYCILVTIRYYASYDGGITWHYTGMTQNLVC